MSEKKQVLHDPVPDGRSGPFMREPHKKTGKLSEGNRVLAYDDRCPACREGSK